MLTAAQKDPYGTVDTVFAEIMKIDDYNRSITISCFNDEDVVGIAIPIHMSTGQTKVVADSAIWVGGRVENWDYKAFRPDTAIQCALIAGVANIGPTDNVLAPGRGRLVTVFVSSTDGNKIDEFSIDTTTVAPDNSLMFVVDRYQGTPPDTVKIDFKDRQTIPAWVIRKAESTE